MSNLLMLTLTVYVLVSRDERWNMSILPDGIITAIPTTVIILILGLPLDATSWALAALLKLE